MERKRKLSIEMEYQFSAANDKPNIFTRKNLSVLAPNLNNNKPVVTTSGKVVKPISRLDL